MSSVLKGSDIGDSFVGHAHTTSPADLVKLTQEVEENQKKADGTRAGGLLYRKNKKSTRATIHPSEEDKSSLSAVPSDMGSGVQLARADQGRKAIIKLKDHSKSEVSDPTDSKIDEEP